MQATLRPSSGGSAPARPGAHLLSRQSLEPLDLPWPGTRRSRAGPAAPGAFLFTSPQLAGVPPAKPMSPQEGAMGPCRDPPTQHRTPLFFSILETAEQMNPTKLQSPTFQEEIFSWYLMLEYVVCGLWKALHPPGPAGTVGSLHLLGLPQPGLCPEPPEPSMASLSVHFSCCCPWVSLLGSHLPPLSPAHLPLPQPLPFSPGITAHCTPDPLASLTSTYPSVPSSGGLLLP